MTTVGGNKIENWRQNDIFWAICLHPLSNSRPVFIMTFAEWREQSLLSISQMNDFIERFWRRRDPDLATEANERIPEPYRRLAYAWENETIVINLIVEKVPSGSYNIDVKVADSVSGDKVKQTKPVAIE